MLGQVPGEYAGPKREPQSLMPAHVVLETAAASQFSTQDSHQPKPLL